MDTAPNHKHSRRSFVKGALLSAGIVTAASANSSANTAKTKAITTDQATAKTNAATAISTSTEDARGFRLSHDCSNSNSKNNLQKWLTCIVCSHSHITNNILTKTFIVVCVNCYLVNQCLQHMNLFMKLSKKMMQ